MRFLLLTQYFPPEIGAPQTRLAAMARELVRRGYEVEIVTAMPHHLLGRTFEEYRGKGYCRERFEGMTLHRTWVYAASGTGLRRLLNYLSFTLSSLIGIVLARRADYIFVESPPLFLCFSGWVASLLHRAPMIFNVADLWPDSVEQLGLVRDGPLLRFAQSLERWAYRRAEYVNSVSVGISEILLSQKALPRAKLLFLPNGIDTVAFVPRPADAALIAELGLSGKSIVLYAGTHGVAQGLETLIDAAAIVPQEIVFLFVGTGHTKPALIERVRRLGLHNVRFVDPVPLGEMPRYFSMASASIVPLVRNELFKTARPSKIFPSLACAVPVIFSGEGEGAALIEQAGAGISVPPQSPRALAGAVTRLCAQPEWCAAMGARGRAFVEEHYAWSLLVGRWLGELTSRAS